MKVFKITIIGPITNATNLNIKRSIFVQVMYRFIVEDRNRRKGRSKAKCADWEGFSFDTQKLSDLPLPSQKSFISVIINSLFRLRTLKIFFYL